MAKIYNMQQFPSTNEIDITMSDATVTNANGIQ